MTLADIGALNAFGYDRRSALWQAERAVRPSGALFTEPFIVEDADAFDRATAGPEPPPPTPTAKTSVLSSR